MQLKMHLKKSAECGCNMSDWFTELSPWDFVSRMSIELTGVEMRLIQAGLNCQIELNKKRLEKMGIVDSPRENEKKIRLNKEPIGPWVAANEKEMNWRGMISVCNRMKMKLLNYAILYTFVSNFYGPATILAIVAKKTGRILENAVPDNDIAEGLSHTLSVTSN